MSSAPTSEILAQAFRALELAPISGFGSDAQEVIAAEAQYEVARHMVIEACDWSWASVLADLPEISEAVQDADLPYAYQLPAACLLIRNVVPAYAAWRIDGRILRSDQTAPLRVRYSADITNENLIPATARTAIALQLAVLLAPKWLPTASKMQMLKAELQDAMARAMRNDRAQASVQPYDPTRPSFDIVAEALR